MQADQPLELVAMRAEVIQQLRWLTSVDYWDWIEIHY